MALRVRAAFAVLVILLGEPVLAQSVRYEYDLRGRLIQVTAPDGTVTRYQYDDSGNILKVENSSSSVFAIGTYSPNSGKTGDTITISGTGLASVSAVYFNGVSATFSLSGATSLSAAVPTGATSGPLTLTSGGQTVLLGNFAVLSTVPALGKFSTPVAAPGMTVSLSGSGFDTQTDGENTVTVNGINARVVAVAADRLDFVIPPSSIPPAPVGQPGTPATVSVRTRGGTSTVSYPLYLVPRVAFAVPGTATGTAGGRLGASGDAGLVTFAAGPGSTLLGVLLENVSGSGQAWVHVFNPDHTIQLSRKVPIGGFRNLSNGRITDAIEPVNLSQPGVVVAISFEVNSSLNYQASGDVRVGAGQDAGGSALAASVFNPGTTSTGNVSITEQQASAIVSTFNPATSTSGSATLSDQKSIANVSAFNPGTTTAGSSAVSEQQAVTPASIFNPGTSSAGSVILNEQRALVPLSAFNPGSTSTGSVTLSEQQATAAVSTFNPGTSSSGSVALSELKATTSVSTFNPGTSSSGSVSLNEQQAVTIASTFNPGATISGSTTLSEMRAITSLSVFSPAAVSFGAANLNEQSVWAMMSTFHPISSSSGSTLLTEQKVVIPLSVSYSR
jgi:YD repeat-containing protein